MVWAGRRDRRAVAINAAPDTLEAARRIAHAAVQWGSRAARANLPATADDGHSNLGWRSADVALVSHPLDAEQRYQLGFGFIGGALLWYRDGALAAQRELLDASDGELGEWCDERLVEAGLRPTGEAQMPYELEPADYAALAFSQLELATLGGWFAGASDALLALVARRGGAAVAPPLVRCWPHHFDIAALFALEAGDPESARSIGVGLSPGDDTCAQPYLYCNPWPLPDALPGAPEPFHWHTDGFTSLICPAQRMAGPGDLATLSDAAFDVAVRALAVD